MKLRHAHRDTFHCGDAAILMVLLLNLYKASGTGPCSFCAVEAMQNAYRESLKMLLTLISFPDRIHGSVDCLSELSSSRLSRPFTGESSAVVASFCWDLCETCVFAFITPRRRMRESRRECLTGVISVQGQSAAASAHRRPSPRQRRRAGGVLPPGGPHVSRFSHSISSPAAVSGSIPIRKGRGY